MMIGVKSPLPLHGAQMIEFTDFCFGHTQYPEVYQGGRRGVEYAKDWIAAHKLEKCNLAHQMTVNLMIAHRAPVRQC